MLRWVAVAGQLITVLVASVGLGVELPYVRLVSLVAITAVTNVLFTAWIGWRKGRNDDEAEVRWLRKFLVGVMSLDLVLLTGLLYYSGGVANPFIVFYTVNLALAAILLPVRWAWMLTLAALAGIAFLTWWHKPLPDLAWPLADGGQLTLGRVGVLTAYATCAVVVTYFITQVSAELQRLESNLRIAEQKRAQSARLEALATLAAGAGHEMASPLSTIAVVANELSRHLEGADVPSTVLEDVSLIRSELDHCRSILDRMSSGNAGQAVGEEMLPVSLSALVHEVTAGLRRPEQVQVEMPVEAAGRFLTAPLQGLAQAIRGVVQNALDASPPTGVVSLRVAIDATEDAVLLRVIDQGPGMTADVLSRVGEPFFTTKEPGKGMGLGMFLTRNVIDRLGGRLELESAPGAGCTAMIFLPLETQADSPT